MNTSNTSTKYTLRQVIGATLVILAGGYLIAQLAVFAVNTSTYM